MNPLRRCRCLSYVYLIWPCTVWADGLEEVIVTATKRAENVQDIPISLLAVSGEEIRRGFIHDLGELSLRVPNVNIHEAVTSDNVLIRGLGSGAERGFEQAVALFVDNIYMPRSRQYRVPLFDIERVEIARGPQALLFGLNASAGAIAVHSARPRPGGAFFTKLTGEYDARFGGTGLTATIGGSASDSLGFRFAAKLFSSGDGYWRNLATGMNETADNGEILRGSMSWEPNARIALDLKIEGSRFETDGNTRELFTAAGAYSDGDDRLNWIRGQDASLLSLFPTPRLPGFEGDQLNVAAELELDVENGALRLIAGYSDHGADVFVDLDGGPLPMIDAGIVEDYEQSSIEFSYASSTGRPLDFLVGAYLHTNVLGSEAPALLEGSTLLQSFGFPIAGFEAGPLFVVPGFDQQEDLVSGFGLLTWSISDHLKARGGARYVYSEKQHTRAASCLVRRSDGGFDRLDPMNNPNDDLLYQSGFCPTIIDPARRQRTSDNLLPELSLQWFVSDDLMFYGKLSASAKSGGFAAGIRVFSETFEYNDETGTGFEAGIKSSFSGGAGTLNLALFHAEYDDLQVNSTDPDTATAIINNAGEVMVEGAELDVRYAVTDWLVAGASMAYLDAEFDSFVAGPCYPGETRNPDGVSCDKTGRELPYTPETSGHLFADVEFQLTRNLKLMSGLDIEFSEGYFTNVALDPLVWQPAYTRLEMRLGLGSTDDSWTISVVAKNLTDEIINDHTVSFLGVYRGYIREPRTVWLRVDGSFGGG